MNDDIRPDANSRRPVLGGALAAGIAMVLASRLPEAAADSSPFGPVKLVCVLRRRSEMTPAQFDDFWLNVHAPVAVKALTALGATRYVQNHTIDSVLNTTIGISHSTGAAYDGIAEAWFPSEHQLAEALATPAGKQAGQALADNEKAFINLPQSSFFVTTEHVLLG
ncbi:EthD domain-containing protein [Nocardia beijingensis]|uniref:EthD domain-containing protein n=1 Tax=Nocardia beijingensis TaxID=95162 RepID=UPI00344E31A7